MKIISDYKTVKSNIKYKISEFKDGEISCKIESKILDKDVVIIKQIRPKKIQDDFIKLIFLITKIKTMKPNTVKVIVPYMPYLRQDKIIIDTMVFMLNKLEVDKILLSDPHIDANKIGLKMEYESVSHYEIFKKEIKKIKQQFDNLYVIAPDDGAKAKAKKIEKAENIKSVYGKKTRDKNGKVKVIIDKKDILKLDQKACIIVDDIMAGGDTIIETAKLLKNAMVIIVMVSHNLIASKKTILKMKNAGISMIYTTNSTNNYSIANNTNVTDIAKCMIDRL